MSEENKKAVKTPKFLTNYKSRHNRTDRRKSNTGRPPSIDIKRQEVKNRLTRMSKKNSERAKKMDDQLINPTNLDNSTIDEIALQQDQDDNPQLFSVQFNDDTINDTMKKYDEMYKIQEEKNKQLEENSKQIEENSKKYQLELELKLQKQELELKKQEQELQKQEQELQKQELELRKYSEKTKLSNETIAKINTLNSISSVRSKQRTLKF